MKFRCVSLILILFSTGCLVTDDPLPENSTLPLAENWSAPAEVDTNEFEVSWVDHFNDPTLQEIVTEALVYNHDLKAAAYRFEEAGHLAIKTGADLAPQIDLSGGAGKQRRSTTGGIPLTDPEVEEYNLGFNLNWELDLWGRLRARRDAAIYEWKREHELYRAARLSLVAHTIKSWYDVVENQLQIRLAHDVLASFEENLKTVEDRYNAGIITALDLRLTRANTAGAKRALQVRLRNHDASARSLEVLLGRYPNRTIEVEEKLAVLTHDFSAGLPSELLARRPDVRAAERKVRSSEKQLLVAEKAFLPNFRITGAYGSRSDEFGHLLDFNIWSIAANAVQPVFQGRRLQADARQKQAALNRNLKEYSAVAMRAFGEVERALAAERYLEEEEKALKTAVEESVEAEALALSEYNKGLATIFAVLESQRRSFTARSDLLSLSNQRIQNRIDLFLALGGDFRNTKPQNN